MAFTHVAVVTNAIETSRMFYDKVLATLGWTRIVDLAETGSIWGESVPSFMVTLPRNGAPATAGNGTTISFHAPDHASVRTFHEAALALGMPDEGAVGPRSWAPGAVAAHTRDPDGNKLTVYGMEYSS